MSDKFSPRALDPEGVADGDYVLTVAGGHVTGFSPASAGGGSSVAVDDEGVETVAAASRLNFTGAGVTVTDAGSGEATVSIPGGGGSGGGDSSWTVIGAAGAPAYGAGWNSYEAVYGGGEYEVPAFRKDASGWVHLRGMATGGGATSIFTLPVGYRPDTTGKLLVPAIVAGNGAGRINLAPTGTVTPNSNWLWVSLSGITFKAA